MLIENVRLVRLTHETLGQKRAHDVLDLWWNLEEMEEVAETFKAILPRCLHGSAISLTKETDEVSELYGILKK